MDLGKSIYNTRHSTTLITSVITKVIIDIFQEKKSIDISGYIISVQIRDKVILVKTWNPMMNGELLLLSDVIESAYKQSMKDLGASDLSFNIRYI